ncbi:hypothetical protein ABFS82_01G026800 [Erythranthe guttata]|uniref:uncharacterized protein LOC105975229 n=1 Tax=Erythranthe guttata TaxID=4155 RepID=UPI00064DBAE5|nr:PREDICTED: uncharacterized protein LOC105975229 [Erythranthe guttata]|eukprot:XP_012855859.1 PREDICTED: uncharacterized protein LOC105975229 [Erythranthe guttata]
MEHGSHPLDLPVSQMHVKMAGQVSTNPEPQHFYVSTERNRVLEPISGNPGFTALTIPNSRVGYNESLGGRMGSSPIWMSNQLGHVDSSLPNNMSEENSSFSMKRKAEMGPLLHNSNFQQSLMPNKRLAHTMPDVNSVGFMQPSAPQRKIAPDQSKLSSTGSAAQSLQNKKMVRNDSLSGKSSLQRGQPAKKQTVQIGSASKVRAESLEAVRSKMRESLAAALALALPNQDTVANAEKTQSDASVNHQPVDSSASEANLTVGGHVPVSDSEKVFPSKESSELSKTNDGQVFSSELAPNVSSGSGGQAFQGFQYGSILPDEDVPFVNNFYGKDDLLQGNGLSWAFDLDAQMGEGKEVEHAEKTNSVSEEVQGQGGQVAALRPEDLAFVIESELFVLFGDVNKKYREKGRSLLFNLKDRSNPELRERVMSGEISPQRLCSMSAEELASKELSEWRMAKAEELGKMVVLPDTEVDIRRLVRKTHKGEFQVEVEHDDGIAAEISGGTTMLTRPPPKKETQPRSPPEGSLKDKEKIAGQEGSSEDQEFSGSLIIPTDGTDLMQGIMVDELKDAEFLPPIVSLDEFMESLNNEPPFEDLSVDSVQKTATSHGESPKPVSNSRASRRASDSPKDAASKKVGVVKKHDVAKKSSGDTAKEKVLPITVSKVDYVWGGTLQLHVSSSVHVGGIFQSGEKTSTKEWPNSLEIKGRVRLDAFEKFLQELPMSRTRAVMVLQFVSKDKSSEEQRSSLSEAIDSFVADERLGYAEPVPAVELYLCPPTSRILDMLNKYMPKKEHSEAKNSTENGLIGVVVWRRAHVSNTISPNSSSHHKHTSKKQPFATPKRVQDSPSFNSNTTNRSSPHVLSKSQPQTEEDDDIPPGFGPAAAAAAREDDDLPEFNFSGNMNTAAMPIISPHNLHQGVKMTQRPVDQVRELIKKYGQSGSSAPPPSRTVVDNKSLGIKAWNDDDDDIPEWRPQAPQPPHHQHFPAVHGHRPPVPLVPSNQLMPPMASQQQPPPPPGGRWVQPPGPVNGGRWRQ